MKNKHCPECGSKIISKHGNYVKCHGCGYSSGGMSMEDVMKAGINSDFVRNLSNLSWEDAGKTLQEKIKKQG